MEGITLLLEARKVGLDVRVDGDELVIRGPRSQGRLARMLLDQKHDVLVALKMELQAQVLGSQKVSPHLDANGVLVIPFDCHKRFHWWNGGQCILTTLGELDASEQIIRRYVPGWNGNREQNRFERN